MAYESVGMMLKTIFQIFLSFAQLCLAISMYLSMSLMCFWLTYSSEAYSVKAFVLYWLEHWHRHLWFSVVSRCQVSSPRKESRYVNLLITESFTACSLRSLERSRLEQVSSLISWPPRRYAFSWTNYEQDIGRVLPLAFIHYPSSNQELLFSSDSLVNMLCRYAINTGALTRWVSSGKSCSTMLARLMPSNFSVLLAWLLSFL